MKCKDCVHFDICEIFYQQYGISKVSPNDCGFAKEKSSFVELPCKVGTTVYSITDDKDERFVDIGYVNSFAVEKDIVEVYVRYENGLTYCFSTKDIGERVFYTYDEAEKALMELRK